MILKEYIIGFLCGCFGGLAVELLALWKIRTLVPRKRPKYYRTSFYWIITMMMIFMGGGLVLLYLGSGTVITPILGFNIGASAPLILGAAVNSQPELSPGKVDIEIEPTQE